MHVGHAWQEVHLAKSFRNKDPKNSSVYDKAQLLQPQTSSQAKAIRSEPGGSAAHLHRHINHEDQEAQQLNAFGQAARRIPRRKAVSHIWCDSQRRWCFNESQSQDYGNGQAQNPAWVEMKALVTQHLNSMLCMNCSNTVVTITHYNSNCWHSHSPRWGGFEISNNKQSWQCLIRLEIDIWKTNTRCWTSYQ